MSDQKDDSTIIDADSEEVSIDSQDAQEKVPNSRRKTVYICSTLLICTGVVVALNQYHNDQHQHDHAHILHSPTSYLSVDNDGVASSVDEVVRDIASYEAVVNSDADMHKEGIPDTVEVVKTQDSIAMLTNEQAIKTDDNISDGEQEAKIVAEEKDTSANALPVDEVDDKIEQATDTLHHHIVKKDDVVEAKVDSAVQAQETDEVVLVTVQDVPDAMIVSSEDIEQSVAKEDVSSAKEEATVQSKRAMVVLPSPVVVEEHVREQKELQQVITLVAMQQEQIDQLKEIVNTLEGELRATRRVAKKERDTLQQFARFKERVLAAQSYIVELKWLIDSPAVSDTLHDQLTWFADHRNERIPSAKDLKLSFHQQLNSFYRIRANGTKNEGNVMDKVEQWFSSLVTIRKVGSQHHDDSVGSILARAEHQIDKGDIALALEEIRLLDVAHAPHFKDWTHSAHLYVESRKLLDAIERNLFEGL